MTQDDQKKVLERFLKNGTVPDKGIQGTFLGSPDAGKTFLSPLSVLDHEMRHGYTPPEKQNRLKAVFKKAGRKIKSALKRAGRGLKLGK